MSSYDIFVGEEQSGDCSHQLQAASQLPTAQATLLYETYLLHVSVWRVCRHAHGSVGIWRSQANYGTFAFSFHL